MKRWPNLDAGCVRRSNRKQAVIPAGATVLEPVGTAPGLVVAPAEGDAGPTVVVLPGPPRELQPMWETARATEAFAAAIAGATELPPRDRAPVRDPRVGDRQHPAGRRRRPGSSSSRWRSPPACGAARSRSPPASSRPPRPTTTRLLSFIRERHADTLFSLDGSTIDEQLAELLAGETIAVAESCTGGGLATRLTDRAGSSAYFLGGAVVYSNQAKIDLAGVDPDLIERTGAVSTEVARGAGRRDRRALRRRSSASASPGIAGPGRGHRGQAGRHGLHRGLAPRRAPPDAPHAAAGVAQRRP